MQVLENLLFILVTTQVINSAHSILVLNETSSCLHTKPSSSVLRPAWHNIFRRKRRYILFPKGGTFKFTVFLSKAFLARYPRGFNFLIEAAFYYPAPWQRIDLIPKPLRPVTTKAPQALSPTKPTYIYIPGSDIRYKAKTVAKPQQIKRIDQNVKKYHYLSGSNYYSKYSNPHLWDKYTFGNYTANRKKYSNPHLWDKYTFGNYTANRQKYSNSHLWDKYTFGNYTANRQNNFWISPKRQNYKRTFQRKSISHKTVPREKKSVPDQRNIHKNQQSKLNPIKPTKFSNLEDLTHLKHYHSHRDRRQLFYHFEGFTNIIKFDMKLCILRAICDAKKLLLPKGYSLIHDILRVLFTFPTVSAMQDEYSRVMKADFETCDKQLNSKCSINLLDWFGNIASF